MPMHATNKGSSSSFRSLLTTIFTLVVVLSFVSTIYSEADLLTDTFAHYIARSNFLNDDMPPRISSTTLQPPASSMRGSETTKKRINGITTFRDDDLVTVTESSSALEVEVLLDDQQDPVKKIPRGGGIIKFGESVVTSISDSKVKCWMVLAVSIIIETLGAALSKQARDSASMKTFCVACALYLASMVGFAISLARIEVGIAYSIWGAVGSLMVTIIGIAYFGESCEMSKIFCLVLIGSGVAGLNIIDAKH